MIDFIKSLNIQTDIDKLQNNPLLEFESSFKIKTGETNEKRKQANFKDLTFNIIESKYLNLSGSLHKYFNNGLHNYNDFQYSSLIDVIIDLCQKFNLNPFLIPLNNIEFGVNINTQFRPKTFIQGNIINYKGQSASINNYRGKGYFKEFVKSQYIVKIYDKGLQFNRDENILRFEIKSIKMEFLSQIGIYKLSDLLNIEKMQHLGNLLIDVFNDLLVFDESLNLDNLPPKEKEIIVNGINPMFWENLLPDKKDYLEGNADKLYIKDRNTYYRKLKQFKAILSKHKTDCTHKELSKVIQNKWNELLKIDIEQSNKMTVFLNSYSGIKQQQNDRVLFAPINPIKQQNDTSNMLSICLITRLDISMQKTGSKFLGIVGIKFYQLNDPKIYFDLEKRLSKKWIHADTNKRIYEIAHSIRNEYFNKRNDPRNNTKRSINKLILIPGLFNNLDLIDKRKLELAEIKY